MTRLFRLALAKVGNNKPAKMAMMAITTNNSINVKPNNLFVRLPTAKLSDSNLTFISGIILQYSSPKFRTAWSLTVSRGKKGCS